MPARVRQAGREATPREGDGGGGAIERASGDIRHNMVGYIDTMLEYYLHIDPSTLSDDDWAEKFKQLGDIRRREAI